MRFQLTTAIAALLLVATSNAIPTISAKGSKFFTSDGKQWYIKGVAYQPTGNDPLADPVQCALDAPLMQKLGANAIRIYHADPYANHDACMATFAAAGIYVFADLDTYSTALVESLTPVWTPTQFANFSRVMDAFSSYTNMAGFLIGNEVLNIPGPLTVTAPFIKAATTDLKAYRDSKGYRSIPVGYAHADVGGLRPALPEYLACGSDFAQSIDFFALNSYLFCGNMTYAQSGYMALYEQTQNYTIPIFMSETGCNVPEPRYWLDENSLFGPMADVWSGAIIYDWVQQDNHYGIITYGGGNTDALDYNAPPGGFLASGTPTPITPDFSNLLSVWATNTPTGVLAAAYTPPLTTLACPAYTAGVWEVAGNPLPLPTLGVAALQPFIAAATSIPSRASLVAPTSSTAPPTIISPTLVSVATSTAAASASSSASLLVAGPSVASLGAAAVASAATPSAFGANAIIASTSSLVVSESYSLIASSLALTTIPAITSPMGSATSSLSTTTIIAASPTSVPASSSVSTADVGPASSTMTVVSTSTTTMVLLSSTSITDQTTSAFTPLYTSSNTTTTTSVDSLSSSLLSSTMSTAPTAVSSTFDAGSTSSAVITSSSTLVSTSTVSNGTSSSTTAPALAPSSTSSASVSTTTLTTATMTTSILSSSSGASSSISGSIAPSSSLVMVSSQSSTMSIQVVSSVVLSTTTPSVSRSTVVVAASAAASTSKAAATGSAAVMHANGDLAFLYGGLVLGLSYLLG